MTDVVSPKATIIRPVFWGGSVARQPFEAIPKLGVPVRPLPLDQQIVALTQYIASKRRHSEANNVRLVVPDEVKPIQIAPTPPAAKPKAVRPGSEFFGLPDVLAASGRRLDDHARELKREVMETEKLAAAMAQEQITQQQKARDFINEMRQTSDELGNGGPPLADGDESSSQQSPNGANGAART